MRKLITALACFVIGTSLLGTGALVFYLGQSTPVLAESASDVPVVCEVWAKSTKGGTIGRCVDPYYGVICYDFPSGLAACVKE